MDDGLADIDLHALEKLRKFRKEGLNIDIYGEDNVGYILFLYD